ncbi:MAG: ABC transporter ATP-binding protein [Candidatus Dormibacteria bacterium]
MVLFVALTLGAVLSLGRILITGALVRAIPGAISHGHSSPQGSSLAWRVLLLAGVAVLALVLTKVTALLQELLRFRVRASSRQRLLAAYARPEGIAHLEDDGFLNRLAVARGAVTGVDPGAVVDGLAATYAQRASAVGAALLLASFRWWAPVLLIAAATGQYLYTREMFGNLFKGWIRDAAHLRKAEYRRDLTLTPPGAKEVRVFGLSQWLVSQFDAAWLASMVPVWRERRWVMAKGLVAFVPVAASLGVVCIAAGRAALAGELDVGSLVIMVQASLGCLAVGTYGNEQIFGAHAAGGLTELAAAEAAVVDTRGVTVSEPLAPGTPLRSISFEGVSFRYPGADRAVLDGIDLRIDAGSSVAIVGENGAGKTTLVKLLARLYEPAAGRIAVDDADLKKLDLAAWRGRLGVIFQDFARWELPLRDNVGFGDIASIEDDASLHLALSRAGAEGLVSGNFGLDTILSPGFEGGVDLSGGQWQRVALARALFAARNGGVLILDEPTANLDVRAEAQLFEATLELAAGATTILISHRFTTVRKARRIVVLHGGRVVEDGTHDELLAAKGRYAEMFNLQAAQFLATPDA